MRISIGQILILLIISFLLFGDLDNLKKKLTNLLTQTDAQLPPVAEHTAPVAAAVTPAAPAESDELLFNIDDAAAAAPTNAKTTGEEDPFGNVVTTQSKDAEFDDFFNERAASKQE